MFTFIFTFYWGNKRWISHNEFLNCWRVEFKVARWAEWWYILVTRLENTIASRRDFASPASEICMGNFFPSQNSQLHILKWVDLANDTKQATVPLYCTILYILQLIIRLTANWQVRLLYLLSFGNWVRVHFGPKKILGRYFEVSLSASQLMENKTVQH